MGDDVEDITGSAVAQGDTTEIEHEEHAANVRRMLRVLGYGVPILLGLALVGLFGLRTGKYQTITTLWVSEGLLILVALGLRRRLLRRPLPSVLWLRVADTLFFGLASLVVAVICTGSGGLASEDTLSLMLVLIAQTVTQPARHGPGALRLATSVVAFLMAMFGSVFFMPSVAAQMRDPAALAGLTERLGTVLGGGALLVVGGHAFWMARRKVIETRTAGRYVLKKRIGTGGMGEIWSAFHPALKRDVAVKILRPDRMNADMIARFEREIAAMTDLSHPNTVRVLDCGTTEHGLLYFVMELVLGDTLKALVAREGPLPPARAIHIVRQTARALAEAHAHGIIHRDIKPDNILVTSAGGEPDFVKVLDFGIAKLVSEDDDPALTHVGVVVGTPTYLSPEQAAMRHVDARSDLYSLGAVLFFALTGRPPFVGSLSTLLLAHLEEQPPFASTLSPHSISAALDAVVHTCLAKSPAERYLSALDLDVALAAVPNEDPAAPPTRAPVELGGAPDRDRATVRPGPETAARPPALTSLEALLVDRAAVTEIVAVRELESIDRQADTVRAPRLVPPGAKVRVG